MSLGDLALTGVFPKSKHEKMINGPVDLVKCDERSGCGLVQLKQSYSLDAMYGMNYGYRSGLNKSMVQHLHSKVNKILSLGILDAGDTVIDIGSNDSTTLSAYPKNMYQLIGIDPTGVKFSSYYSKDITLIPDFFSANTVKNALGNTKAKIITSFSMFYDLEDPTGFAREIEETLHDDGVWILEQSYLPAMLRTNSFDTICHEHLEFYSLQQINWICKETGLKVLDVDFNQINGGSFSIIVAKENSKRIINSEKIAKTLAAEKSLGLSGTEVFEQFKDRIESERQKLTEFLSTAKSEGKSVYALGASTKGNVLLQYFNINTALIKAIGEVNHDKVGAFTPGTYIPIISENEILISSPDYILILPWHFRDFFVGQNKLKGMKLIFPLPTFEIIET